MSKHLIHLSLFLALIALCQGDKTAPLAYASGEEELFDVPLDPDDFAEGEKVENDVSNDEIDQLLAQAGLFQGDLPYTMDEIKELNMSSAMTRSAIRGEQFRWPDGIVPYTLSTSMTSMERSVIASALSEYKAKTCIRFVPRSNQQGYIHITKGDGCSSMVGRTGRLQRVTLGQGCYVTGIVVHELMHALGFWHEQSRVDRDDFVTIMRNNIMPQMLNNFEKLNIYQMDVMGSPYDACSVMHYGDTAFAKSYGLKTIVPKRTMDCRIGQRKGLSDLDMKKINTLYKCQGYATLLGPTTKPAPKPTVTAKPEGGINKVVTQDHKHCVYWSKKGECRTNPTWMMPNCPIACGNTKKCADNHPFCQTWAAEGQCEKYKDYMDLYCYKSCHCQKTCEDEDQDCQAFAAKGYCQDKGGYGEYMKLKCRKSCQFC